MQNGNMTNGNSIELFSVFYLVGGSNNFICKSLVGKFIYADACEEVNILHNMGYKAMSVKNGHIVGGYCSFTDFDTTAMAVEYYECL